MANPFQSLHGVHRRSIVTRLTRPPSPSATCVVVVVVVTPSASLKLFSSYSCGPLVVLLDADIGFDLDTRNFVVGGREPLQWELFEQKAHHFTTTSGLQSNSPCDTQNSAGLERQAVLRNPASNRDEHNLHLRLPFAALRSRPTATAYVLPCLTKARVQVSSRTEKTKSYRNKKILIILPNGAL